MAITALRLRFLCLHFSLLVGKRLDTRDDTVGKHLRRYNKFIAASSFVNTLIPF